MKRIRSGQFGQALVVAILLFAAFMAGSVTGYSARTAQAAGEPSEFGVFWEAWNIVVDNFVDRNKIDFTAMTYGAIQGMLDSLGDENHTTFFSPEVAEQQASALEGTFEGIGTYVSFENGVFTIVAPIRGSPAEQAGIVSGDIVLAVDGEDVQFLPYYEVVGKLRGRAGTTVTLTVLHAGAAEPVDIDVVRQTIEVDSVLWARVPGTDFVHLQITQFATDTGQELHTALVEIGKADFGGGPVRGILLDLRNNPGGFLMEALITGNQFLEEGAIILHQRDADGRISTFRSRGNGSARTAPLVVLVNEGSASAAEILAGAIQENGRGKLVGETTLGTGTVLRVFDLSDGSVVRLGVTNWLTPNQHLIAQQGIEPDVMIEQAASAQLIDSVALEQMEDGGWESHEDRQFRAAVMLLSLDAERQ